MTEKHAGGESAEAAVAAVRSGDLLRLQRLLDDDATLASVRLARHGRRTLLHVATDWPGHFPNVMGTVLALVRASADPNAPGPGEHAETPLHWAASGGDLAALDALLDAGADINTPGAVIARGTPMADATAFGEWAAARRLLDRGARTNLFESAALGLVARSRPCWPRSYDHLTPLDAARRAEASDLEVWLAERGAIQPLISATPSPSFR